MRDDLGGASLVEFALIAPVVFGVLIAILQMSLLGMVSANFNGAMESVSRRIRTGQADRPASAEEFRNLICTRMVDTPANCQARVKVTVQPVQAGRFSDARVLVAQQQPGNLTGQQAYATGRPEQVMLVTATYSWPMLLPFVGDAYGRDADGNVLIVSRLAFRNEPWE